MINRRERDSLNSLNYTMGVKDQCLGWLRPQQWRNKSFNEGKKCKKTYFYKDTMAGRESKEKQGETKRMVRKIFFAAKRYRGNKNSANTE
jgi:hypothetical protein